MKNTIKMLLLTLGMLFLTCTPSHAQFINNYSIYSTQTITDSTHMKQTVVFSGTTTADPREDPHFIAMLATATHTPTLVNKVIASNGTVYGGLTTGVGQCWNCYVNYSTTVSNIPISDGATFTTTGTGNVNCTLMGSTWLPIFQFNFHAIVAYERVINNYIYSSCKTDPLGFTTCNTTVSPWCTADTLPPMLALDGVYVQTIPLLVALDGPYFDARGLGLRYGTSGPYTFSKYTTYAIGLSAPQPLAHCTPASAQ